MINLSKEATIERNIIAYLNNLPMTKAVKWSQEGRSKGHPDIICCHSGLMILIEVKRPGKVQDMLQEVTMDEWRRVGVITAVVTEVGHVVSMMESIMREEQKMREEMN